MGDERQAELAAITGDDVRRGLIYAHNRANANTAEVHQTSATLNALVGLLVECGVLDQGELDARRAQAGDKLRQYYVGRGMAVAMQEFAESKYVFQGGAAVVCESRVPLCRAACCKLPLALSKEDVAEGVVRWELDQPYMIAHAADGYCVHLDRETHGCTVYQRRPIPCRGYDCREDERVWVDFEGGVVNPLIYEPDWLACLEARESGAE
jgi:Fe-S-cluster containining protein